MNKTDADTVRQMLPFWRHLSDKEKDLITSHIVKKSFIKGEVIMSDRKTCMGLIIIKKGDVRVSIISDEGKQITLFHVCKDEVCVMTASCAVSALNFDTLIAAACDTEIYVIPSSVLESLSDSNIYVKAYMYELLTERFSEVVWIMEQIVFKRIDERLAQFLLSFYEKTGSINLTMTQEEISCEINTAREVASRMLKQFAQDNLLEVKRGNIILKDINSLKSMIN